jgi:hypothetical protein
LIEAIIIITKGIKKQFNSSVKINRERNNNKKKEEKRRKRER